MSAVLPKFTQLRVAAIAATLLCSSLFVTAVAQGPTPRIRGAVIDSDRVTVPGTHPAFARPESDAGEFPGSTTLQGMTIVFNRSAAQQADLDALIAAQQNPASPLYQQWLTPDQFAARFGVADSDLSAVSAWLSSHGFQINSVSRGRNRISFSGSAAQFGDAFNSPIHYFTVKGEKHFSPSTDISLPSALAGIVAAVENVTDFRPRNHIKVNATPAFTSAQTSNHYLTPKDVATIYDVNPAYNAGFTGAGISIAVIGESAILTSDITNFQTAAGVTVRAPTLVLEPGTGGSQIYQGEESESDLDLEYSSSMAPGASIYFVYTGSSPNYSVFDAMTYAINNRIGNIITVSYGQCEPELSNYASLNLTLQMAAAQGQTVVNSTGDQGSTACYGDGASATIQTELSVSYPASSQYVTAVGGTEFPSADVASTNTTYWQAASGSDVIGSALSYIPEIVWNDDSTGGISASGGGSSTLTARPSWQTGVPGIPSGTFRLIPDVSLAASPSYPGYIYCTSDTTSWASGQNGSCSNGFRDNSNYYLTVAGGTSFAAPSFAGLLAVIAQKINNTGLGLVNPTLYTLAANATTYASAFHDITSGTNGCTSAPSSLPCATSSANYTAGVGYDEATGLGSVDFNNLLTAWPSGSTLAGTKITLSAATKTPAASATDAVTITVAPASGSGATPTGTVTVSLNGASVATLTLVNGGATYTFPGASSSGNNIVLVSYSGNSTYAASSNSVVLTVSAIGSFTISAPALTINTGSTGTETITLTPAGGYTGSVGFTISGPTIANTCFTLGSANVTSTAPASAQLVIYTSTAACLGASPLLQKGGKVAFLGKPAGSLPGQGSGRAPLGISLAGLLAIGWLGRRSRRLRSIVVMAMLAVAGFGLSGCGDSSTAGTATGYGSSAVPGSYTFTITGTDAVTPTVTSSTTFVLTINS